MLKESVHGAGSVERCQSEQADSGSWKEELGRVAHDSTRSEPNACALWVCRMDVHRTRGACASFHTRLAPYTFSELPS